MNCHHCAATASKEQTKKTRLCSRTIHCLDGKHIFHQRRGTPFNLLEYPTDTVLLVVLWRLGSGVGGLTQKDGRREAPTPLVLPLFSVLTHPLRW